VNFSGPLSEFHSNETTFRFVRKRRWIRHQQVMSNLEATIQRAKTGIYKFEIVEFYENQRRLINGKFSKKGLFVKTDPYALSDSSGSKELSSWTFNQQAAANPNCCWRSEWMIDKSNSDQEGWVYAIDFHQRMTARPIPGQDFVRRRRWCQLRQWETELPLCNLRSLIWTHNSLRRELNAAKGPLLRSTQFLNISGPMDIFAAWEMAEQVSSRLVWKTQEEFMNTMHSFSQCVNALTTDFLDRQARHDSVLRGDHVWFTFVPLQPTILQQQMMRNIDALFQLAIFVSNHLPSNEAVWNDTVQIVGHAFLARIKAFFMEQIDIIEKADGHSSQSDIFDFVGLPDLATMKRWQYNIVKVCI
jgi:hypothetical protein